ncbi:unnamed protein product [Prunus armeniaca]
MYEDLVLKVKNIGAAIGLEEKIGSESLEAATWLLTVGRKTRLMPTWRQHAEFKFFLLLAFHEPMINALGLEHRLVLPSSLPNFMGPTSYPDSFGSLDGCFGAWAPPALARAHGWNRSK